MQSDLGQVPRHCHALRAWLDDPDGDRNQLARWLQGYDLPDQQEDAYVWLLRGLPVGAERSGYERKLAERVASLLRLRPDQQPIGRRPNQLLYNGLMLAVGLRCREVLAEPLWEMYQRRSVSGEWLGAKLRTALRSALIHNQIDQRLKTVWLRMSEGEPDDFLGGNEYAGCEGASMMPGPNEDFRRPSREPLGRALVGVAKRLEGTPMRRVEFRRQLDSVLRYFPSQERLSNEFIEMADESNWPDWCIPSLPSLYLPVQPNGVTQVRRYYLWKPYIEILRWLGDDLEFAICHEICRGQVAVVQMGIDAVTCFDPISQKAEERRRKHPYPTYQSLLGAIKDALVEATFLVKNDERLSSRVRTAHEKALAQWIGPEKPVPQWIVGTAKSTIAKDQVIPTS